MSLNTYPNNPFPPSTEQMHGGDNEELQAQIDAIKDSATIDSFGDVETALATKTDNDVIAPEFDAEAGVYSVGDLVMHEGKLYEFTTAHETAGVWNPEEVTEKTIADEVDTLKSGLNNVTTVTSDTVFTYVELSKNNKAVFMIIGNGTYATNASNELMLGDDVIVLPEQYRPIANFNVIAISVGTSSGWERLTFQTDGKIRLPNNQSGTGLLLRFSASWITN